MGQRKETKMKMDIHATNFAMTPPLLRHVRSRVTDALAPARASVAGVMVRLRDLNGPKGGVDKRCRIAVWPSRRGSAAAAVVNAVDRDLYTAVDAAAAKVREAVRRRRKRRRTLRREYAARRLQRQAA